MSDDDKKDNVISLIKPDTTDAQDILGVDGTRYMVTPKAQGVYDIDGEIFMMHPAMSAVLESLIDATLFYENEIDSLFSHVVAWQQKHDNEDI
jgi:hypothetical protein